MKKRVIALLLCAVMLVTCMGVGVFTSSDKLDITVDGEAVESVSVPQLGKVELSAKVDADSAAYRWQFSSDGDTWIDIYGETGESCTLTYAKVKNMLNDEGTAQLRCIVSANGEEKTSTEVSVSVEQAPAMAAAPAKVAAAPAKVAAAPADVAPAANGAKYTVTVKYVYENGGDALEALSQSFVAGESVNWSIPYPAINGYSAKITINDGMRVSDEAETGSTIGIDAINRDYTVVVTYSAKMVDYTVTYYYQKLDGSGYDTDTVTRQGKVNSEVPTEVDKNGAKQGFAIQQYETATVEADGSTSVGIYYDRIYYLVKFNLDGGTGLDAVYAPFETPLNPATPEKKGYSFAGWEPNVPPSIPIGGGTYKAKWTKADTKFVVAYYYENANDSGYTYMGSVQQSGKTGASVNGENYQGGNFAGRDDKHFKYHKATTATVNGDGSTVVKVYFNRVRNKIEFYICTKDHGPASHGADTRDGSFVSWGFRSCKHDTLVKVIEAKYGANIASEFASVVSASSLIYNGKTYKLYGHRWSQWNATSCTALVTTMGESDKYYLKKDEGDNFTIKYMYETENGRTHLDGNKYSQGAEINITMSFIGYGDDYMGGVMTGYAPYAQNSGLAATNSNGQNVNFDIRGRGTYYLYYYAQTYNIDFMSNEQKIATKQVKFGFSIKNTKFTPSAQYAPAGYEFDGWYTDENLTDPVDWNNAKMPAGGMVLYAKWKPITYTVKFLWDEGGTQYANRTASYGTVMSNVPADPTRAGQSFVGWFYKDNGVEKAFDPANMQVKGNMTLYAKWSSNNMKQYFVYFVDENGNNVASPKTGQAAVGKELTIAAKAGTQLYRDYQNGYFPTQNNVTFTIKEGGNSYYIKYEKRTVGYTVHYLEEGTGKVLHDPKVVTGYDKSIVTESFVPITDFANYIPIEPFQQTVVLTTGDNTITFWYKFDKTKAAYTISHYKLSENGNKELYGKSTVGYATKGSELTEKIKSIDNYEFDIEASIAASTEGCNLERSGSAVSAKVLDGGVNIELIYKEKTVTASYEAGVGGTVSVPSETIGVVTGAFSGSVASPNSGYSFEGWYSDESYTTRVSTNPTYKPSQVKTATYYAKFVENEATIQYKVVGPDGTVYSADSEVGKLTSYSETVGVVTGKPSGSEAEPASNVYKFVGWYSDEACSTLASGDAVFAPEKSGDLWTAATYYAKFEYNLTSMTLRKEVTGGAYDANDMFIFTIKDSKGNVFAKVTVTAGQEVTISGLTVGEEYTITEDNNWSWRYDNHADVKIVMEPNAADNDVTVTNTLNTNKWLGASSYAINKCVDTISYRINEFFAKLIG